MITTTPILNIDKLDYQYAGLPLGMSLCPLSMCWYGGLISKENKTKHFRLRLTKLLF